MQESQIVEIFKTIITSNAVNDVHLTIIIGFCFLIILKKWIHPIRNAIEKFATKLDIKMLKSDIVATDKKMEDYLQELHTDFENISRKIDILFTKSEIQSNEMVKLKSDLEQIKKYIDNVYLLIINNKNREHV